MSKDTSPGIIVIVDREKVQWHLERCEQHRGKYVSVYVFTDTEV